MIYGERAVECKFCGSERVVKNGKLRGEQSYKCSGCGRRFVNPNRFPKMRNESQVIVTALDLYWEGLSVRKTQRQLRRFYGVKASQVTIWKWVMKYTELAREFVKTVQPQLSGDWHVDETVLKVDGENMWFWDIIDRDTKFLVASHLSGTRTIEEVATLFRESKEMAKERPKRVFVDGMWAYRRGFNMLYYSRYKADRIELIIKAGIDGQKSNSYIERFHSTLKDRVKVMRGLKDEEKSKTLLQGWVLHYNFLRPHQSLDGKTPAQVAGIDLDPEEGWKGLIEKATAYQTEMEKTAEAEKAVEEPAREKIPILVRA